MMRKTCMIFVLALLPAKAALAENTSALAALIVERLSVMQAVAAWKLSNDRPVEDLPREAVVIDAAKTAAAAQGVDPDTIDAFFRQQIEAAKDIQFCWIDRWQAGETPPQNTPDLSEIRAMLLPLGEAIVKEMAGQLRQQPTLEIAPETLSIDCLKPDQTRALAGALKAVRLKDP
ncbi:MAG: gamma subclass chorismate mutase AroQ [Pseudomonadota bacterium]